MTAINYPTNLTGINTNALDTRDSDKYFNNFFDIPPVVSTNIDAAIVSYFEKIASNKTAARAMASAVIYTSKKQGIDPLVTLEEFKKVPEGTLNAYVALFLNLERVGTSYLGVSNQTQLNKYVQRSLLP